MEQPTLSGDLTVAEVLARWPQTIHVFIRHRMACAGCPLTRFETLAEVAVIYGLNLDSFLNELVWTTQESGERM
jgi:hybrid cluster-associated redox disulfide protein